MLAGQSIRMEGGLATGIANTGQKPCLSDSGVLVTKGGLHSGQQLCQVLLQLLPADVVQHLLQARAHPLPGGGLGVLHPSHQNGDNLLQHSVTHLAYQLA